MDLVTDATTGRLRESAVWSNVGKLCMTWAFIFTILHDKGSEWLWMAYGGIVVTHELAARFFNQRQQQLDKEPK
jgi:drug/metabolite transporter superfamily protein YnfA